MLVNKIGNKLQNVEQKITTPVLLKTQVAEIEKKKEQYLSLLSSKKTTDVQMNHLMGSAAICVYQEYLDKIGSLFR